MKRMDPKKYCTNAVERKKINTKTAKEFIVKSHSSEQWGQKLRQKPANTEGGEQSQQPMTTLEDKGRHTHTDNTHRGVQRVEDRK